MEVLMCLLCCERTSSRARMEKQYPFSVSLFFNKNFYQFYLVLFSYSQIILHVIFLEIQRKWEKYEEGNTTFCFQRRNITPDNARDLPSWHFLTRGRFGYIITFARFSIMSVLLVNHPFLLSTIACLLNYTYSAIEKNGALKYRPLCCKELAPTHASSSSLPECVCGPGHIHSLFRYLSQPLDKKEIRLPSSRVLEFSKGPSVQSLPPAHMRAWGIVERCGTLYVSGVVF